MGMIEYDYRQKVIKQRKFDALKKELDDVSPQPIADNVPQAMNKPSDTEIVKG